MPQSKSLGTRKIPLQFAEIVTQLANEEFEKGSFLEKVSPITRDLLKFWNPKGDFAELRNINFHEGQWQAILNAVYLHEVLKIKGVYDMYMAIQPELLGEMDLLDLKKDKYEHPKYCMRMATGTGKTWVMHALLIWQYLNSKYEESQSGRFSKNFLLISPGIIVYERLLDAYLGKQQENGVRNFDKSDFKMFDELFLLPAYKEEILGFVQSNVVQKEEIGRKITGDGLIAITNWHILTGEEIEKEEVESPFDNPSRAVKELLPISPGTSKGQSLEVLDNKFFKGKQIDFLSNLPDLVSFNDEAHHLGEWKKSDETLEKKWQEALLDISRNKKEKFIQFDFSATPYNVTGSGQKRTLHFFPHIIINFELKEAIFKGLVKMVAIDKRKELGAVPLDDLEFKAEREGKEVKDLSDGQRLMIRAGISRLRKLEEDFIGLDENKHPKMLITCEDTNVVPFVMKFLKSEGLSEEEVTEIHSNKKSQDHLTEEEWKMVKQKLFNIDKHKNPKIIVSVLMLREGFDVSNICVIVPLRSSSSYILLEQIIGRGLRLMWREPEYEDSKEENRDRVLFKKVEPNNYMDILTIVEHPNFIEFYRRVLEDAVGEVKELPKKERVVGDFVKIGLKQNYQEYDLFWPIIIQDKEEHLVPTELSLKDLEPYPVSLEELKKFIVRKGETFYGEEIYVKTKFGEHTVASDIFTAKNYQQFIQKIVNAVSSVTIKVGKRKTSIKTFPIMQINVAQIAKLTDDYIRIKLFGRNFEPLQDNNWRILLLTEAKIIQHIVRNVSKSIYDLQNSLDVKEAKVIRKYFSEVFELRMRENFSLNVAKTIYERIAFPSNRGGFEKAFIEFIDSDSKVERFIKINEYYHTFANVLYIRDDGLLANYFPDFIVKIGKEIYLVETKAEKDLDDKNVLSKKNATIDWIDKINELNKEDRMNCSWYYVLLGEKTFYSMSEKGANVKEILECAKLTKSKVKGTLGDYLSIKEY